MPATELGWDAIAAAARVQGVEAVARSIRVEALMRVRGWRVPPVDVWSRMVFARIDDDPRGAWRILVERPGFQPLQWWFGYRDLGGVVTDDPDVALAAIERQDSESNL